MFVEKTAEEIRELRGPERRLEKMENGHKIIFKYCFPAFVLSFLALLSWMAVLLVSTPMNLEAVMAETKPSVLWTLTNVLMYGVWVGWFLEFAAYCERDLQEVDE